MRLPAFEAVVSWAELWRILEVREGMVYRVESTGKHIEYGCLIPLGYTTVAISAKPGSVVNIVPFEKVW